MKVLSVPRLAFDGRVLKHPCGVKSLSTGLLAGGCRLELPLTWVALAARNVRSPNLVTAMVKVVVTRVVDNGESQRVVRVASIRYVSRRWC